MGKPRRGAGSAPGVRTRTRPPSRTSHHARQGPLALGKARGGSHAKRHHPDLADTQPRWARQQASTSVRRSMRRWLPLRLPRYLAPSCPLRGTVAQRLSLKIAPRHCADGLAGQPCNARPNNTSSTQSQANGLSTHMRRYVRSERDFDTIIEAAFEERVPNCALPTEPSALNLSTLQGFPHGGPAERQSRGICDCADNARATSEVAGIAEGNFPGRLESHCTAFLSGRTHTTIVRSPPPGCNGGQARERRSMPQALRSNHDLEYQGRLRPAPMAVPRTPAQHCCDG